MANYFPNYTRGESLVGYSQRCSRMADLVNVVDSLSVRLEMCREHAQEVREFQPKQPFSEKSKIVSEVKNIGG